MLQQRKSLVIHVLTGHAISNGKFNTFHCEKQRVVQPRVLLQKKRKQTAEVNIFLLKPTSVNSHVKQGCCSVAGRILLFSCLYIKSKTSMYLTNASSDCIQKHNTSKTYRHGFDSAAVCEWHIQSNLSFYPVGGVSTCACWTTWPLFFIISTPTDTL